MLKIQCSKDSPCKPCLSSAVRGYERKVLSFCYCVRTRFVDVDIFHSDETASKSDIPASVRSLMDLIVTPTMPSWDENVFEDTLVRWLVNPEFSPPEGSVVNMICQIVGESDSLRRAVDAELTTDFRTFLFTTSLAHTGWKGSVAHRDLCVSGHLCGSRIVRRLDKILTPQFLAKCNKETHRALLLLLFGLILGVSYSTRLTTSPSFPHDLLGPEIRHSPTLWLAMKEHLAQMLAHHLIFLGSILGIKLDTASEKTIIDTAVNRWNKPERSIWAGLVGDALPAKPTATKTTIGVLESFNSVDNNDPKQQDQLPLRVLPPPPPPPPLPLATPMVALTCPDVAELHSMPTFSENPASYLSMENEEIQNSLTNWTGDHSERDKAKDNMTRTRRTSQKRSMWIVRPFDDGGNRDVVNVFARFNLQDGQSLGLFA
ncbi:hypothetical protein SPI_07499 [Niveomyces insectorum RCEF 264]|uniref:Uncharacterized protein n=1 Tax=Niveomyces insectorum RCEF 264 TaxID=1081102 RepID=A0A167PXJ4_9HYPO|nr:hypothetical protein SPI_07499 [Niveomyces insectorum RCEF 264]